MFWEAGFGSQLESRQQRVKLSLVGSRVSSSTMMMGESRGRPLEEGAPIRSI
ncbi:hypothetical protein RchiOBHm_Chr7g0214401 [Rosa chinensis]|uniref:Uncharacterized protein n=1 Tax=Rosa chinensis TaxID=74649 RepID=A0A2P6PB96_ROSCH|nr:hypothetical protein RchiOBHm_Chr7g0214401 [Rosa chinensis]